MLPANEWVQVILLGGLAGLIGQGIRVVVGLKKLNDSISSAQSATPAGQAQPGMADAFDLSRLLVSLLIGFVAGALAAITLDNIGQAVRNLDPKTIMGFVAAGYAGTDFIEGLMQRYLPSGGAQRLSP